MILLLSPFPLSPPLSNWSLSLDIFHQKINNAVFCCGDQDSCLAAINSVQISPRQSSLPRFNISKVRFGGYKMWRFTSYDLLNSERD